MQNYPRKEKEEEYLIRLASSFDTTRTSGRHREKDGTIPGWHSWSKQNSQKDSSSVKVCHGRSEWSSEFSNNDEGGTDETFESSLLCSVISWNILSDTWLSRGRGSYNHTCETAKTWSFRLKLLLQWIEEMNPDVLCLQEVDYEKFDDDNDIDINKECLYLLPNLSKLGYEGMIQKQKKKKKNSPSNSQQPCAVATFWKRNKFRIQEHNSFSRALCVVLETAAPANSNRCSNGRTETICITNVHLECAQTGLGAEKRARQLNSALKYSSSIASTSPLILCGDFNTGADSPLLCSIRDNCWKRYYPTFNSVYEHPNTLGTLPVSFATYIVPGHHYSVDHMLYVPTKLRLRCVFNALSEKEKQNNIYKYGRKCGFPSKFCPSDHIPIGSVFELIPSDEYNEQTSSSSSSTASTLKTMLSEERKLELIEQWKSLRQMKPPRVQVKGKPSEEEIVERKSYASSIKTWKRSIAENNTEEELEFISKLIKESK